MQPKPAHFGSYYAADDRNGKAVAQWEPSTSPLDLWEGRGGSTCSTIRSHYSGIKYSLASLGDCVSTLSQHAYPSRLSRVDLSQNVADALGEQGQKDPGAVFRTPGSQGIECHQRARGTEILSYAYRTIGKGHITRA